METKQQLTPAAITLLRKVQQTITEEPNRLNMGQWAKQFDDNEIGEYVAMSDEVDPTDAEEVERQVPSCGTMGCIAGWTAIHGLTNLPTVVIGGKVMVDVREISDVEGEAAKLLGINRDQRERLFLFPTWERAKFRGFGWPQSFADRYAEAETAKERAKVTCERIDYFIENLE